MKEKDTCCENTSKNCINPLIELYHKAVAVVSREDNLADAVSSVLNQGLVLSHSGKICCPDCTAKNGYYYLGSYTGFKTIAALYHQIVPPSPIYTPVKYPCCLNKSLTATDAADFKVRFLNLEPPCCDTSFPEVFDELLNETGLALLLSNQSVIEASTFNSFSGLQIVYDYLKLEGILDEDIASFFLGVFTSGLVIKCVDCDIIISSVSSYGSIGAAYGLLPAGKG